MELSSQMMLFALVVEHGSFSAAAGPSTMRHRRSADRLECWRIASASAFFTVPATDSH